MKGHNALSPSEPPGCLRGKSGQDGPDPAVVVGCALGNAWTGAGSKRCKNAEFFLKNFILSGKKFEKIIRNLIINSIHSSIVRFSYIIFKQKKFYFHSGI